MIEEKNRRPGSEASAASNRTGNVASSAGQFHTEIRPTDRPEWREAVSIGDAGERAVADAFRRLGFTASKFQSRCADLTIAAEVEVKTDLKALDTGRVAVEVGCRGKASGLRTTCAGLWAFRLANGETLAIPTVDLRAAVADLPEIIAGECAMVRLLPLADLRRLSLRIGGAR